MAAGTQYNKHLNYDQAYVKTPAVYDSNLDEWVMLAGNYVKTAGGLWVPQKGSDDGEALVQLTGRIVTIANSEAITDTSAHYYDLITKGGMLETEVRQYRNFKISLDNSHNQTGDITIGLAVSSYNIASFSSNGIVYQEDAVLSTPNGRLLFTGKAGGTGTASTVKVVPCLENTVISDIFVVVQFDIAPTSGSVRIKVEMN